MTCEIRCTVSRMRQIALFWGVCCAVQMQLSRIIISEISDNQVVFLQEVDGPRHFPIMIGMFEAASIDRRIKFRVQAASTVDSRSNCQCC